MAARLFQSILLEVKGKVPFMIGVVDTVGNIVSCTELKFIGENIETACDFFSCGEEESQMGGYTFRLLDGYEADTGYAVFACQTDEAASIACGLTAVAISNSKSLYDEKHDKLAFIKKILLDNILPGDIYIKSRELHFQNDAKRCCFTVRVAERQDALVVELLQKMFPDRQHDFVVSVNGTEVVLVKELKTGESKEVAKLGKQIDEAISEELEIAYVIGIGGMAGQLKDVARSFKEAQVAMDIGRVFDENMRVMNFENLGIGRLIYQLPTTLCEMFLSEVFKKGSIDALDEDMLSTINTFFKYNLNVSQTSDKLFVHRNTLVYRLDKIRKLTGLDLREFDNAVVLKVALMVRQYLKARESYN